MEGRGVSNGEGAAEDDEDFDELDGPCFYPGDPAKPTRTSRNLVGRRIRWSGVIRRFLKEYPGYTVRSVLAMPFHTFFTLMAATDESDERFEEDERRVTWMQQQRLAKGTN